jgi:glutathione synthase
MKLNVAIQMDHVSTIDIDGDSTFVLGLEAEKRGYAVWHYTPPDLIFRDRKVMARAQPMKLRREKGNHFTLGAPEMIDLATLDVVMLRQDPPFDMSYITTTHLLEHIHPKTLVVNDPASVRNAPEKLFVTHFDNVMPPTLITADARALREFRDEHQDIILKPLFGNGGAGVFRVRPDDENFASLLEMFSQRSARAGDRAALPTRGTQGRQAHHPDRRQGGRCDRPGAGGRRERAPTCMSAARP